MLYVSRNIKRGQRREKLYCWDHSTLRPAVRWSHLETRWIHLVSKWAPMAAPGAMAEDVNSTNSRQFELYELCIWTSTGGCLETTIVGRCICAAVKPRGFRLGDPGVVSCQRIHRSEWLAGQAPGPVGEAPC